MDDSQTRRKIIIFPGFDLIAEHLVRMSQIYIKRGVKILDALILDLIRVLQCELIPAQGFLRRLLKAGYIMGGDAGFIVIG